jgi:hypothetical protein
MKTNLLHRLKSNARAGKKCIELKSELTILLLLFVALAGGGCETLESGLPLERSLLHPRLGQRRLRAIRLLMRVKLASLQA